MNIKIGIIWLLIIATAVGTGTVVYNNFKIKDARDLMAALSTNVIPSVGSGISGSGDYGSGDYGGGNPKTCVTDINSELPAFKGYDGKICTPCALIDGFPIPGGGISDYDNTIDIVGPSDKIKKRIDDFLKQEGIEKLPDWITGKLKKIGENSDTMLSNSAKVVLCSCAHSISVEQLMSDALAGVSALLNFSPDMWEELSEGEKWLIWMKYSSALDDAVKAGQVTAPTCERAEKLIQKRPIPKEPMPGTNDIFPVSNWKTGNVSTSGPQILFPGDTNIKSINQTGSINLVVPTVVPKPLVAPQTNTQLPFVGPVQTALSSIVPSYASKPAATSVLKKAPSAEVCGAAGLPTAFTCRAYTTSASRQINPVYVYKGVTYSLSYTRHKNTKGAACRDLCVATAK